MTDEGLSRLAGVLLSLALTYIPGLAPKYDALSGIQKAGVFLLLSLIGGMISLLIGCTGVSIVLFPGVSCTTSGVVDVLNAFILTAQAGAATYLTTLKLHPKYSKAPTTKK